MIEKSETVMQGLDIFPGIFLQSGNSKKNQKNSTMYKLCYAFEIRKKGRKCIFQRYGDLNLKNSWR